MAADCDYWNVCACASKMWTSTTSNSIFAMAAPAHPCACGIGTSMCSSKGGKDRVTILPKILIEPLRTHLARVKQLHELDLQEGFGRVYLPFALDRKYPNADKEWGWPLPRIHALRGIRTSVCSTVCVSGIQPLNRSTKRRGATASCVARNAAAGNQERDPHVQHHQTRKCPYVASFFRNAPVREWFRYSNRTRTSRTQRREHDYDLHACTAEGREGSAKSARWAGLNFVRSGLRRQFPLLICIRGGLDSRRFPC
jgi:hypothetical protein